jgi:hypothetical protein
LTDFLRFFEFELFIDDMNKLLLFKVIFLCDKSIVKLFKLDNDGYCLYFVSCYTCENWGFGFVDVERELFLVFWGLVSVVLLGRILRILLLFRWLLLNKSFFIILFYLVYLFYLFYLLVTFIYINPFELLFDLINWLLFLSLNKFLLFFISILYFYTFINGLNEKFNWLWFYLFYLLFKKLLFIELLCKEELLLLNWYFDKLFRFIDDDDEKL